MFYRLMETSWGWVAAAWTEKGLAALTLPGNTPEQSLEILSEYLRLKEPIQERSEEPNSALQKFLTGYFTGQPAETDIEIDWSGYTRFQKRVLKSARQIPYGEVRSYRQVAEMIGSPQAARAVGNALSSNRHLLVVPCHRVIRQNGSLGGFGCGPGYKERLLKWEGSL